MKLKFFIALTAFAITVLIVYSQTNTKNFAPAEDFPRDAVLYVQIADLPALIKLWNESEFKENYLKSANFDDFKNNHLGRKMASRWQEFNDAAGFPLDLELLGKFTGNQAAVALYDVGKLEFVFIAPVSDEIFAATKFTQQRDKFSEETLDDGTIVYRAAVEADRGRQKQELIFAQLKGKFILATSEKLLAQTLGNINGNKAKNRLIDEPAFKNLSEKVEPHAATVWLDQTALNDDYYFKRYWLMSDIKNLKNLRAGIFDFEMQEGKLIERRKFLLDKAVEFAPIENAQAAQMLAIVPPEVPFYRLQTTNQKKINEAVEKTIFARRQEVKTKSRHLSSSYTSFDDYGYSYDDYSSLGEKFDEAIDDANNVETTERREIEIDFSKILETANPRAILTFTQPVLADAPLFAEFRQAAVFNLASPEFFNKDAFESAVSRKLSANTLISFPGAELKWETKTADNFTWRELNLPMINYNIGYTMRDNTLIIVNNTDFLRKILTLQNLPETEKQFSPFNVLTVINLDEKENAYDRIVAELSRQNSSDVFFTGNISSFLDSISRIKKIEIREFYTRNTFDQEISIHVN